MPERPVLFVGYKDQDNLGLGYLAAVLAESGFESDLADFRAGQEHILARVRETDPLLIGLSIIFQYYTLDFGRLVAYLRANGVTCPICAGGHYPSLRRGSAGRHPGSSARASRSGVPPGIPASRRRRSSCSRYWRRDGRSFRFFFAQLEAAETIIFLNEARRDFLQGIDVPRDEPSDEQKRDLATRRSSRYACKMATGSGKTTVMGMLAAWSILNKVNDRANARFSDVVLVVCPNVTIRSRLARARSEARRSEPLSHARSRAAAPDAGSRAGAACSSPTGTCSSRRRRRPAASAHGRQGGPARGSARVHHHRREDDDAPRPALPDAGGVRPTGVGGPARREGRRARQGRQPRSACIVVRERYVESDTALVNRVLGREVGGKQNILVLNDEAHHAYRIRQEEPTPTKRTPRRRGGRSTSSSRKRRSGSTGSTASTSCAASTSASICRRRRTSSGASARRPTGRSRGSSATSG